jgi:hypothetical protein
LQGIVVLIVFVGKCINIVHISPWPTTEDLFNCARTILPAGAPLYLYGPYKRDGMHTAPSNAEFDSSVRARDGSWGVRDLEAARFMAS